MRYALGFAITRRGPRPPLAVAAVARLTERKVIAFMSDNHIDPDMAAEVFVLEPLAEGQPVTEAD